MKIWDVKQGQEEWLALRKSYFTGSALGEWLLDGDRTKTSRKAWQNAIWNKLGELSQDDEPNFPNWAMKRGTELEPLARAAYESHTGFKVREVGFISHDSDGFGVSPDGLIMDRAEDPNRTGMHHGLELKCPVARTMLKWLDAGTLPDEHKLQVHASLAASGLQRWDFFAYHPELVPLHIIVERDEFTEQVLAGLLKLSDDYSAAKAKLAGWIATPTNDTP
jgi:predicted phage-related endonuclease